MAEEKCIVDYCCPFQDEDIDSQATEKNQSIEGKENSRMVIHGRPDFSHTIQIKQSGCAGKDNS